MSEVELAQKFVDYLSDTYDLYYEVYDIDIVGIAKPIIVAFEVKKCLNFKVIEQAHRNRANANYSYIAIPVESVRANPFAITICRDYGIGIMVYEAKCNSVYEKLKPKFNRNASRKFLEKLTPDSIHKRATPGAKSGKTATAFSETVDKLETYVRRHQGCLLKDAIENITFHYSSQSAARSNLKRYIDSGIIKSIRCEGDRLFFELES